MDLARVAVIIEHVVILALLIPVCIGLSFAFTIWLMTSAVDIMEKFSKDDKNVKSETKDK